MYEGIPYMPYNVDSLISLTRWLFTKTGSRDFFPYGARRGRPARLAAWKDAARRQTLSQQ